MASTYLSRSISSTGNQQKMTFSAWVKGKIGSGTHALFVTGVGSARSMILIEDGGKLQFSRYNGGYIWHLATNRRLRDMNAWYHIVCAFDTTQSTASDRAKIYINGVQETSLATSTYPSLNYTDNFNLAGQTQYVGQDSDGNFDFDGIMSHVHYIDGTAYDASTFGSTDSTTGEWKINTSPSITMGTNGFTILKDGNTITDQSSNSNNFTLGAGTLTKTEDCPSNVFSTVNPNTGNPLGLSNGNLKAVQSNGATSTYNPSYYSNLGYTAGKFYWETKVSNFSTGSGHSISLLRTNTGHIPTFANDNTNSGTSIGSNKINYFFGESTTYFSKYGTSEQSGSLGSTLSSGDIVGMSHDVSAGELKYFVNGSQIGSTITGVSSANDGYFYIPYWTFESKNSSRYCTMEWNMGNGYFGTTAVSNAGTNASGIGIFEYDVPTGYTALSTKGLNL